MFRTSLLTRLVLASVVIAACAVGATAFLATTTTTQSIQQQQGESLANDAMIYKTLLKYSASHTDWSAVDVTVDRLSSTTGLRIALMSSSGKPIADSAARRSPLPGTPSAIIDPLAVNVALQGGADPSPIDSDVVGPYQLSKSERHDLQATAEKVLACVNEKDKSARISSGADGRPSISTNLVGTGCGTDLLQLVVPSQEKALKDLEKLANVCLGNTRRNEIAINADFSWVRTSTSSSSGRKGASEKTIDNCVLTARREQLGPYVAPSAVLYLASPAAVATVGFDLGGSNQTKVISLAVVVFILTIGLTIAVGMRIVRPLRSLTAATQKMSAGDDSARVQVRGRDEIAQLSKAFNAMSSFRAEQEKQRKTMMSDIAHELRTPLTNIRGWLEATRDGLTPRDANFTASLLEEALLLEHVVDDLQDLAMADAGALSIHAVSSRVRPLLDQVLSSHRETAVAKRVSLVLECEQSVVATVDPLRFRQAVGNLVGNAIKYTPEGGTVTVLARVEHDLAAVTVVDTGMGITETELEHVFDRFWRAEKSRNRETGGSGLGLAIARKLVEAHGGTAEASSTVGVGSSFTLSWPTGAL